MWECSECKQEITKDKYKVCWNCGTPKAPETEKKETVKKKVTEINQRPLVFGSPQIINPSIARDLPKTEIKPEPIVEPKTESALPKPQIEVKPQIKEEFLPVTQVSTETAADFKESSSSKFKTFLVFLLWLGAIIGLAFFAYQSNQKMLAFEQNIQANTENFNNQKSQFVFPPLPTLGRDESLENLNFQGKVLPLNMQTKEVDRLYSFLPDDLRPNSLEEAKTLFWLDCTKEEVGRYSDGAIGYQNRCKTFLVERETSKFIGIQDFIGIMPALAKTKESEDAVGDVLPERYITFLKTKQVETERSNLRFSSDSPDHHFFNKSEFYYAVFLLVIIAAIGFGWLAYKLKFDTK